MSALVFKPVSDGVESVHRREGEPPFARLFSPRAVRAETGFGHIREWGVKHGKSKTFNNNWPTRADAEYDLARTARVCNDFQLGLSDSPDSND